MIQEPLTRDYFFDKHILVFGFGMNGGGLGTVQFLLSTKAKKIVVTDLKTADELQESKRQIQEDERLEWHLGEHEESDFRKADIIIKNPGIKWDNPLITIAEENGSVVLMDSTIFLALCEAPIIGVTGSKGKTTTATLIAHILEVAEKNVVRVGISQTGVLSELSRVTRESVVVFELSSWRLSGLALITKSPSIAVVTNLYPDHLNYYKDMEEYARDKSYIYQFQNRSDTLLLSRENEWSEYFAKGAKGKVYFAGKAGVSTAWQDEKGLYLDVSGEPECVLLKKDTFFQGEYLFQNFLLAALATHHFGISLEAIRKGLETFSGVPHRFELVREVAGVRYINDTAATIPSASLASLQSVSSPGILLAGGSDKGLPQEPLVEAMKRAKYTILFSGSGTDKLLPLLDQEGVKKYQIVESMREAVLAAQQKAVAGECVLLAPGAASFGMFQNEFDRGEQFRQCVKQL